MAFVLSITFLALCVSLLLQSRLAARPEWLLDTWDYVTDVPFVGRRLEYTAAAVVDLVEKIRQDSHSGRDDDYTWGIVSGCVAYLQPLFSAGLQILYTSEQVCESLFPAPAAAFATILIYVFAVLVCSWCYKFVCWAVAVFWLYA